MSTVDVRTSVGKFYFPCGERQTVTRMAVMDPEIWSQFPPDVIPRVLRYLPWWCNRQLRATSTSWNALLSDNKFLAECPPSDQRVKPCFASLTLFLRYLEVGGAVDLLMCYMTSGTHTLNDSASGRDQTILARLTTWTKCHADPSPVRPPIRAPTCCDTSTWMRGKFQILVAPVSGVFFGTVGNFHSRQLLLMNPFNSTIRELPPVPSLGNRCSVQASCGRYSQLVADDENPKNLKIIVPHFAFEDKNLWTLIVYDLVKGSWSMEGAELPINCRNAYSKPTSVALLSGDIYVLLQGVNVQPRLLRFIGRTVSDYPMPPVMYCARNSHIARHKGDLMLARGIRRPFAHFDVWRSKRQDKPEDVIWERVAVMPSLLLSRLCTESDRMFGKEMSETEFVKFSVDGDFMCFRPGERSQSMFVILLDMVTLEWEYISADDGKMDGFFMCLPRLEIVL